MLGKPTASTARRHPRAYTLVEILIVMGIIAVVAGMTIVLWPALHSSTQTTIAADKVQGMMLIAKQKSIRDRVPTGVRLIPDPADTTGTRITQLIYVSQPEPYTPPIITVNGVKTVGTLKAGTGSPSNQVVFLNNVNFTGGLKLADAPVQAGDYLEINGGGIVHKIGTVTATGLVLADQLLIPANTTNWRIIRQPRPVIGEEPLELNTPVIIDLDPTLSQNVPSRSVPDPTSANGFITYREIMFAPSGSVIGQGISSNDKIILWVRDSTRNKPTDGEPVLIGIQIGTGLIGGYPVDVSQSGGSYYSNTRDPRASGL